MLLGRSNRHGTGLSITRRKEAPGVCVSGGAGSAGGLGEPGTSPEGLQSHASYSHLGEEVPKPKKGEAVSSTPGSCYSVLIPPPASLCD